MSNILIATDNIDGNASTDGERLAKAVSLLEQAGHTVQNCGIGPNQTQSHSQSSPADIMVQIAGGKCLGTLVDFNKGITSGYYKAPQAGFMYYKCWDPNWQAGRAHDDNFSNESDLAPYKGKTLPEIYQSMPNLFYGYGDTIEDCVSTFLANWSGQNIAGGSGGVNVVEGHLYSHEGTTPQFWNTSTYTDYEQVEFTNFTMSDEYPRVRNATFESPVNIDLTEGRVAVLITGDCNDFGGIIIKKTFNTETRLYKYNCQGFMERIMASPVYVVANGGHTAHHLISEYLAEIGLPSVNLLEEDEYDVFVDEATRQALKENEDLEDSTEMFNARNDTKIDKDKVTGVYGKTNPETEGTESESDSDSKIQQQETAGQIITEEESHDDEYEVINTFKAKPAGIYDKLTGADFIRTLIFDYGINIDFYGDVNGIPRFDVMDMETWKTSGWIISPSQGFGADYESNFDITDVVTQVGVKNIQAINGNGELYTSEELLGVNLEKYVGRMGTIVDNPNEKQAGGAQTDQIQGKWVDEEGNEYTEDQIIKTNGEPSCGSCASENGGSKPEMKKYDRAWVNKCPGCEEEGKLENKTEGHGKTVCKNEECKQEYCQFCGHSLNNSSLKLTKVTQVTAVSGNAVAGVTDGSGNSAQVSSGSSSSGSSSGGSSGGSSSGSSKKTSSKPKGPAPGKSAKRLASDRKDAMTNKTRNLMSR